MLRNIRLAAKLTSAIILNEVLSLNAQESAAPLGLAQDTVAVLNEVLSLNAQE